ncbi:helicase ARIP4-like isoform 2-T3 [Synchiropus picturatus]
MSGEDERRLNGWKSGVDYITDDESDDADDVGWMNYQSHSAPFSSENEAQGGDPAVWQCTPPPSTSPSGEMAANTPTPQTASGPRSRADSRSPSPSHDLPGTKKRSSKPAHLRRNIRKLFREHQLEAGTKAAQQEELERRRRLEQQRKSDFPVPLLPEYQTGEVTKHASQQDLGSIRREVICVDSSSADIGQNERCVSAFPAKEHTRKTDLRSGEDDATIPVHCQFKNVQGESEPRGTHTTDAINLRDQQGRVLVNVNHPDTDVDMFLLPQLARAVKPHQIGGIRFLYDNLVESLERFEKSSGLGCILAHSMGLGKTLQVISFIDVLFRHTQAHTVLAIVPVNTLQNWLAEFNTWTPPPEMLPPNASPELVKPRTFKVHILNDEHKTTATRAKVVQDWAQTGGVLLMGYEMYRLLSLKKKFAGGRKKKNKKAGPVVVDLDEEDRQKELLIGIERALSRPGPDIVICDEGHRIKNCHASTSKALKSIRTRRRVVLTGYPLQNNLIEYWCMVDFVRPNFLGTRQEFSNMFERPILNGQCVDSTAPDIQLMRYRSHVLHSLLEGFVQRRGHDVLKDHLPPKEEHVILVRLSPLQRALYKEFMNRFTEAGNTGWLSLNPLKAFCICCKVWNHPDVLYEALQKENMATDQDLDLDDITSTAPAQCPTGPTQTSKPSETPTPVGGLSLSQLQEKANQVITNEWAREIMSDYKPGVLENSAKMVLLFHLIDESVRKGDKILVFSQSLSTLTVIEDFLANRPVPPSPNTSSRDKTSHHWIRNLNYYRLDGSTTASEREKLINNFNDPSNTSAWVFLLSTRAGSLGVNLIGANRVVVLDASWNPCHDAQAVCRVYRYGQKKPCHIYRLVCDFTLEKKIYDRQISKQGMSDRVVDDLNPVLTFTRREVESLLHFVEEEPNASEVQLNSQDNLESVLRKALHLYPHLITKQPFSHESLLMDRKEFKLSAAEKKEARKGYEDEKRASVPYTRPSYAHFYPASDQSLTNIPAFSVRNWRPPTCMKEKPVASVHPVQSTPAPMLPRQAEASATPGNNPPGSSLGGFPVNCLQKVGVFVQKIITTTDIVIPGTNSSTDVQARIPAGQSIHVIRGSKGSYIRTSDGRIFAVRAANKTKTEKTEDGGTAPPKESLVQAEVPTNGTNGSLSPERKTFSGFHRPLSPDGPEITEELQNYTSGGATQLEGEPGGSNVPSAKLGQSNGTSLTSGNVSHQDVIQPCMDATVAQDLRTGVKRKASTPSLDEVPSKQMSSGKHSAASQAFGFPGGYNLPLAMMGGSLGHPLLVGAGSPYFHPSHAQLREAKYMYPDLFGAAASSTSSAALSTTTAVTSSSSSSSPPGAVPQFPLSTCMSGRLPTGFPLTYSPSLTGLYTGSMLPGGLPGPAATPGPAGASFLSQYPSISSSSSSSSSPSSFSPMAPQQPLVVNGDDKDDDVIEVKGE